MAITLILNDECVNDQTTGLPTGNSDDGFTDTDVALLLPAGYVSDLSRDESWVELHLPDQHHQRAPAPWHACPTILTVASLSLFAFAPTTVLAVSPSLQECEAVDGTFIKETGKKACVSEENVGNGQHALLSHP